MTGTSAVAVRQHNAPWQTGEPQSSREFRSPHAVGFPPFTIVHISDPHISRQFYREHIKSFKLLLKAILERGCDHLVITGDIVSTAEAEDYMVAREILSHFGLLSSARLTVVPGNHDIFGGPHRAIDVLSFPQYVRRVDYARRLDFFLNAFAESFEGSTTLISGEQFPFVKRVGPFAIFGLNSIPRWSLWDNPFGSNGLIDDRQLAALHSSINSPLLRNVLPVVALHHHFNDLVSPDVVDGRGAGNSLWRRIESKTMRLKKRRRLLRMFRALNVGHVLHGHIHRNEIYRRGTIQLANGAGAVCDDPVRFLKYNRLTFSGGQIELTTEILPVPFQVPDSLGARTLRYRFPVRRLSPATAG